MESEASWSEASSYAACGSSRDGEDLACRVNVASAPQEWPAGYACFCIREGRGVEKVEARRSMMVQIRMKVQMLSGYYGQHARI